MMEPFRLQLEPTCKVKRTLSSAALRCHRAGTLRLLMWQHLIPARIKRPQKERWKRKTFLNQDIFFCMFLIYYSFFPWVFPGLLQRETWRLGWDYVQMSEIVTVKVGIRGGCFWDWMWFLLSTQQSFKCGPACADVHAFKVIESLAAVVLTVRRDEEGETEDGSQRKDNMVLSQRCLLFPIRAGTFYFEKLPGLFHMSGDFLPGPNSFCASECCLGQK